MNAPRFASLIAGLSAPEQTARRAARESLVAAAIDHMRTVTHRMVRGFPQVRRWDDTDDVVQGASLRLVKALDKVALTDERHLLNLLAMQVRREIIDLARRYSGVASFARHHETNAFRRDGKDVLRSDAADDRVNPDASDTEAWSRFHAVAEALDDEERQLFNLVWYLGLSQEQVATTLGCSVRTVARRWEVVKRHLLAKLEGQAPT